MKKIFLTSTALVLTAGVAAADVTVSGDGRMGVLYDDTGLASTNDRLEDKKWQFTSRIRIKFAASGETDGGLAFGGSVRADHYDTASNAVTNAAGDVVAIQDTRGALNGAAGEVFISGSFGKLAMGDVSGGAETVVGDLAGVGLTGLGDQNENRYLLGANDPSALYSYSVEGLTLALGLSDDEEYSIGAGYDGSNWGIGIGYERVPTGTPLGITVDGSNFITGVTESRTDQVIVGANASFGGFTIIGTYGQVNGFTSNKKGKYDQYGISGQYGFDATTVTAYWREQKADDGEGSSETINSYGLGAEYDLGGGASVVAGIASVDAFGGGERKTVGDLGLSFSF